jgi:hypothetical protein
MTGTVRIVSLALADGTRVQAGKLTVFIGPNNVGKTRALRDIYDEFTGSSLPRIVVRETQFTKPESFDELERSPYFSFFQPSDAGARWSALSSDLCGNEQRDTPLRFPHGFQLLYADAKSDEEKLAEAGLKGSPVADMFAYYFGPRLITFLKTCQRLQLLERGQLGTGDQGPQSLVEHLLEADEAVESEVRRRFSEAFQTDFVIDYSELHRLRVMIGPRPSNLPEHPRKLKVALANHQSLELQGDGIRAFLGLLVALMSVDRPVVLVDEPETFLHPPQARRMGELLAENTRKDRQVFVSTHSVDVLRGIIANSHDVQIVRLGRIVSRMKATLLDPARLAVIAADPVLSSARMLEGLFYSSVIVVEGDRDARFYHAVADRLRSPHAPYFLAAGGKQTIPKLVAEYRRMGVPVIAIVDFDIFRERETLVALAESCEVQKGDLKCLADHQERISRSITSAATGEHRQKELASGLQSLLCDLEQTTPGSLDKARRRLRELQGTADVWRDAKTKGRAAFVGDMVGVVDHALQTLRLHGVFVCPNGELESFFPEEGRNRSKSDWLLGALRRVAQYEVREAEDPWSFVRAILDRLDRLQGE